MRESVWFRNEHTAEDEEMVTTIAIHGSKGEVMAPIGDGEFLRGKRKNIRVTKVIEDNEIPLTIREAFIGCVLPTIFQSEQLTNLAIKDGRIGYLSEIAEQLEKLGKKDSALQLIARAKELDPGGEHQYIVFRLGEFEYVR